jgi:hypothetical protein
MGKVFFVQTWTVNSGLMSRSGRQASWWGEVELDETYVLEEWDEGQLGCSCNTVAEGERQIRALIS